MEIVVTDNSRILDITPLYPELMSEDAKDKVLMCFSLLQDKKGRLYKAREEVRRLEGEYNELSKEFLKIASLFNIKYATYNKKVADTDNTQTGDVMLRHN